MSFLTNKDHDYYFKVLILGDSDTGKSTLLSRFTKDSFDITDPVPTTVGIEYVTKNLKVDGKNIKVGYFFTEPIHTGFTYVLCRSSSGILLARRGTERLLPVITSIQ
jgi:hypothetical protein